MRKKREAKTVVVRVRLVTCVGLSSTTSNLRADARGGRFSLWYIELQPIIG